MIGKGSDYFRRPHVIYHDCKLLPDHMESTTVNGSDFGEIDSSSSSDEWVDGHITAIAGGLSPNWTAALLD
ncbi:hypothetical protein PHMEG_0001819 [Phytophthora megakarya]|uniref:Uncharacterized protein n=1 Tax=Phytophthora megakarya TaxID=4795 RepID=A0A225X098_9STRA|nr:hypothetical protein PHMEG_0001819 [Phytophthora megakarya]